MAFVNTQKLAQMYRTMGATQTCQHITESLQRTRAGEIGHLKPSDFSIRELAEGLVENGRSWVDSMAPGRASSVMETSAASIDSTAFSNITGQLLISSVMQGYQSPVFAVSQAFQTMPTRLSGERIPGIGNLGDEAQSVQEGMDYPHASVSEDYIDTPATDKKGLITSVTKESVFFDRTGLLLDRANKVGESLGLNKEKRCVNVLIGAVNNYKWRGTNYDTYVPSALPWKNQLSGAEFDLVDWTQIDLADQLFNEITDPNTGEPVIMMADTIIACEGKKATVNRILSATEVRTQTGDTTTISGNPYSSNKAFTSKFLYSQLQKELGITAEQARKTWFYGDMTRAFGYMENWPITVVQAPTNSEAEFNRDIVAQYKSSERGVAIVRDPRKMARLRGYAA